MGPFWILFMPPRIICLGIVFFWLAANSWMVFREFIPRWTAKEPPAYLIDLEDEVSSLTIHWDVYSEGKEVGNAYSRVLALDNGLYKLKSELRFHNLPDKKSVMNYLSRLTSSYHVTEKGELRKLHTKTTFQLSGEQTFEIFGVVKEGQFYPEIKINNSQKAGADLSKLIPFLNQPVGVSGRGSVLNTMHPLNKIAHLRSGQQWMVPAFDPFPSLAQAGKIPQLFAEVHDGILNWNGEDFSCWRIDYYDKPKTNLDPERKVHARTWVRKEDNLVLQQEAYHEQMELILKRTPKNNPFDE